MLTGAEEDVHEEEQHSDNEPWPGAHALRGAEIVCRLPPLRVGGDELASSQVLVLHTRGVVKVYTLVAAVPPSDPVS